MKLPTLARIALLTACPALAQNTAPAPSFEVASVKVISNAPGLPAGFSLLPHRSGGRISWTTNLYYLSCYAYRLPGWRIAGIGNTQSFLAIVATMDASATENDVRLMFRKLLAERFNLVAHLETKELQGYALLVAKNGPKLTSATAAGEAIAMPEYLKGKPGDAFEGRIFVSAEGKGTSALTGRGVSTAQFADTLSETLGAFVLDQTGLTGSYYFGFKFLSVSNPADDADAVSLFTALQDELGLKLEKQRGPVELLVVDHVEKPSEN